MQDDMTDDLADDLTVWDFYAAAALKSLLTNRDGTAGRLAADAAAVADAMMAERAKRRAQE